MLPNARISLGAWLALGLAAAACTDQAATLPPAPEPETRSLTLSLSVTPALIRAGESAEIQWSAPQATQCTAQGDWLGARAQSGRESVAPAVAGDYNYRLRCSRDDESIERSVTLQVLADTPGADVVLSLSAEPTQLVLGETAALSWAAVYALECMASGAWSGARALSGSEPVTPAATGPQVYTLDCSGAAAPATASVTVNVLPPSADPYAEAHAEFTRLRQLETRTSSP